MPGFVKVALQSDLPPVNEAKEFSCSGKSICIANVSGNYSAMNNVCPHRGGPLAQGMVEHGKVVCPWHAWAWDVKTGEAEQNPSVKVAIYAMKIEGGDVMVEI